ncbi:hypothetical protein KDL44_02700 [bacterium]|nr:hypothetical protein [bacterium]
MAKPTRCPECGAEASLRLGELSCAQCGYIRQQALPASGASQHYVQQGRPGRSSGLPADDPLIRGGSDDTPSGQLWRLQGGRSARLKVSYGDAGPSTAELGAFIACFFCTTVLMQYAVASIFQLPGIGVGGIVSALFMTGVLAFTLGQQLACLKGFFMLISFMIAAMSLFMIWKAVNIHDWLSVAFSFVEFGLSGWLFSILYRQNINEGL